jgi:hypothetical protein
MFTREKIKELLPVLQAYAEGKVIQIKNLDGTWRDVLYDPSFTDFPSNYRVKPDTKQMVTLVYDVKEGDVTSISCTLGELSDVVNGWYKPFKLIKEFHWEMEVQ